VKGNAIIKSYSGQPEMMNAVSDISAVYDAQLKKAVRGIAIVDSKYVMVRDEIETPGSETTIRWNLVTSAAVTITGTNTAELVKNGKKLVLKVVEPAGVTMKTWITVSPNSYDAANPGTILTGFEATVPANSSVPLTVLLLPDGTSENSSMSVKKLSEWPVTSGK
jgi:hypothetical protein